MAHPARPGGGFRDRLLPTTAAMASLAVFGFSASVVPAVLLRAAGDIGVRPEVLAGVTALTYAGYILASIAGGIAADRIGKKAVFLLACLATGGGALVCSAARGLIAFYAGSALIGMGGGILESLGSALLTDLHPQRRKLMLNLSQVGFGAGAILGPWLIGRWMPAGVSWRVFFIGLLGLALALLMVYAGARIPKSVPRAGPARAGPGAVMKRWSFLGPCLVIFLYVFSETGLALFINLFLRAHRAAPESWAIYGISIFWGMMTVGRLWCAVIPEQVSYERLIAWLMGLAGLTLLVHALSGSWMLHLALLALTGLLMAGTWPLIIGLTTLRNPGFSGSVVGVTIACGALACVVAPPVLGMLFLVLPAGTVMASLALPLLAGAALMRTLRGPEPAPAGRNDG